MSHFPLSVVKTSCVFEGLTQLWDTMGRTWDLASALTLYQPGFGASNNSWASTISNFRIRSLWAKLSVDKRTSGPYSLKKGNYLYRYYCVMDPICWWPGKHAAQYSMSAGAMRNTGAVLFWGNFVYLVWNRKNNVEGKMLTKKQWFSKWSQQTYKVNILKDYVTWNHLNVWNFTSFFKIQRQTTVLLPNALKKMHFLSSVHKICICIFSCVTPPYSTLYSE